MLLLSSVRKKRNAILSAALLLLLGANLYNETALAANEVIAEASVKKDFSDFASLRTEVLSRVGASTKRVWIVTDFLSDAETVSSLYITQYRKVNVQVLLGREKAANILSRLSYLKQVNIPVSLRPKGFYSGFPTLILADDKLISINANLDNYTKLRKYVLQEETSIALNDFVAEFEKASANQNAPNATPLPQVGNPHSSKKSKSWSNKQKPPQNATEGAPISTSESPTSQNNEAATVEAPPSNSTPTGTLNADGSYRYRSVKDAPKSGIATKLPKTTISQEREKSRQKSENHPAPSTNSP